MKKSVIAATLAATALGGAVSVATPAMARGFGGGAHIGGGYHGGGGYRGGGYRGGYGGYRGGYYRGGYGGWGWGAGLAGVAVGAAIASDYPYYGYGPYYGAPYPGPYYAPAYYHWHHGPYGWRRW